MREKNFPKQRRIYIGKIGEKKRPVLVVSIDERNKHANDVLVVPISTTMRELPTHVKIYSSTSGLDEPSMAKCEQITTIEKGNLSNHNIGIMSILDFQEIQKGVLRALGIAID